MLEFFKKISDVNQVNVNKEERLFSFIAGCILLFYALIRIPLTAVFALFIALYLFFRSIRGYCYIYEQLGQNTAVQLPPSPSVSSTREGAVVAESLFAGYSVSSEVL